MWKLVKPLLEDVLCDIDKIISVSGGKLDCSMKPTMGYVVRLYDRNGGCISNAMLSQFTQNEADQIHDMYGSKTYEGQDLYYIRKELFKDVDLCPLCGLNPLSQLDHQMPKSVYKPLALCRLNLVPTCGVCNNKKRAKPYYEFIHPYYADFPTGIVFLIANIHVNTDAHKFSWYYEIDYCQFPKNSELKKRIEKQIQHVKLMRRLMKESHRFVADIFSGISFDCKNALKDFLRIQFNSYLKRYGRNDWRTVILFGIYISDKIGIEEIKWFVGKTRPINRGCNI